MSDANEPGHDPRALPEEGLTTAALARAQPDVERQTEARSFAEPARAQADASPLLNTQESGELRARWGSIQAGFVDEPRKAVEQADALVAGAMKRLAEVFAEERSRLEEQWGRGDDVSTEDLRLALQRYRSFFGRLLSV